MTSTCCTTTRPSVSRPSLPAGGALAVHVSVTPGSPRLVYPLGHPRHLTPTPRRRLLHVPPASPPLVACLALASPPSGSPHARAAPRRPFSCSEDPASSAPPALVVSSPTPVSSAFFNQSPAPPPNPKQPPLIPACVPCLSLSLSSANNGRWRRSHLAGLLHRRFLRRAGSADACGYGLTGPRRPGLVLVAGSLLGVVALVWALGRSGHTWARLFAGKGEVLIVSSCFFRF